MNNGCYCPSIFSDTDIYSGSCTKKQMKRGCYNVNEVQSKLYQSFNGNVICLKRSTTLPKLVHSKTTTNNKCESGYKLCGTPSTDYS